MVGGILAKLKARWGAVLGKPQGGSADGGWRTVPPVPLAMPSDIPDLPLDLTNLDLRAVFAEFWRVLGCLLWQANQARIRHGGSRRHSAPSDAMGGRLFFFPNAFSLHSTVSYHR